MHNILNHFFACKFYHFTCSYILEGNIVHIINYEYDKYFSISAWGKSGVSCDSKVKEKYKKTTKKTEIYS